MLHDGEPDGIQAAKQAALEAADRESAMTEGATAAVKAPAQSAALPRCKNCAFWMFAPRQGHQSMRRKHVCAFLDQKTGSKSVRTGTRPGPEFSCEDFHARRAPYHNPQRHDPDRFARRRMFAKARWRLFGLDKNAPSGATGAAVAAELNA